MAVFFVVVAFGMFTSKNAASREFYSIKQNSPLRGDLRRSKLHVYGFRALQIYL